MRLCRFQNHHLGVVEDDRVYDVTAALEILPQHRWPFPPEDAVIANLPSLRRKIEELRPSSRSIPLAGLALQSPVANPGKIMAAPANYALHVSIDAQDPAIHHGVHHKQLEGLERPVEKLGLFLKQIRPSPARRREFSSAVPAGERITRRNWWL